MTYAIFLLVTAVCAFGLNYLTNSPCLTLASCQTCRDQSGSRVCCTGEFYCICHSLYRCKFPGKTEIKKTKKRRKSCSKRIIHDIASHFPS